MSSIKCPNCTLTNFATAQFCKRCNLALNQPPANPVNNDTQLFNPANNTHIRPTPPVRPNNQEPGTPPYYQNNQQNYNQGNADQNYGQGYQGQQNNQQNYQGGQNYRQPYQQPPIQQPPYQQSPYQQQSYQQPPYQQKNYQQPYPQQSYQSYDYSLPQFPKGQRPQGYQQQRVVYQNAPYYRSGEVAFRRIGNEIALQKNSMLPEICVQCGKKLSAYEGDAFVAQKLRWHHPAVYIALISPLIFLILALCLSERFTVDVPLCQEHISGRESVKNGLIVGTLVATVFIVFCFMMGVYGLGFLVLLATLVIASMVNEYGYKAIRVSKIEGSYYHLKGASNEFLSNLPY
jgi:hypothetical protein